ncbi:MAG: disaggregatase related repeat-containing protein, partial [Methanosarcinaceae archaeon]|nr:disaggregatase related repeat-containing protein [Methanosarcinaceae archaeon]
YLEGKYENTGFFLKAKSEGKNYIAFYSNEGGNEAKGPKLNLEYAKENKPPEIGAIEDQTVEEGALLSFKIVTERVQEGTSYSVAGLPAGANFRLPDTEGNSGLFSWTPAKGQAGTYKLVFTVNKGEFSALEEVGISVQAKA